MFGNTVGNSELGSPYQRASVQYEASFRENQIDVKILPKLTEEDLKELGVTLVGHRRKLFVTIGELTGSPVVPATVAKPGNADAIAERRQLTVMFYDLVGSTSWRRNSIRKTWAI